MPTPKDFGPGWRPLKIGLIVATAMVTFVVLIGSLAWLMQPHNPPSEFRSLIGNGHVAVNRDAPKDLKATSVNTSQKPFGNALLPLTKAYEITPHGPVTDTHHKPQAIKLRFTLDRLPPKDSTVAVITADHRTGPWRVYQTLAASQITANKQLTITTSHLSVWQVESIDVNGTGQDFAADLHEALTGSHPSPKPPTCSHPVTQANANGYGVSYDDSKNTLYLCLNLENGTYVLHIVNRKPYPLEVSYRNVKPLYLGKTQQKSYGLVKAGKNKFILFPGDEATILLQFKPGDSGHIDTQFSGYAQSVERLRYGLETLFTILDRFGAGGKTPKSERVLDAMSTVLKSKKCADAVSVDQNPATIYAACFPQLAAGDPFGEIGTDIILEVVRSVNGFKDYLSSEFHSIWDNIRHQDEFPILVGRVKVNPFIKIKGQWLIGPVNAMQLDIKSNGSATLTEPVGACNPDPNDLTSPMCNAIVSITLSDAGNNTYRGTFGGTVFRTWENSTWPTTTALPIDYPKGQSFTLQWLTKDTLRAATLNRQSPTACRKDSSASSTVCGQ
jgi:hypothetical protein